LQEIWQRWIKSELARRVVGLLLHIENFHHSLVRDQIAPMIPITALYFEMRAHDVVFLAPTAEAWSRFFLRAFRRRPPLTDKLRLLYEEPFEPNGVDSDHNEIYDPFGLWILLDSTYIHDRCRSLALLSLSRHGPKTIDYTAVAALFRYRRRFQEPSRVRALMNGDSGVLTAIDQVDLTWHGRNLFHGMDYELLELWCGREGANRAVVSC